MASFTVYSATTGRILRSGSCHDDDFQLQRRNADELLIEGNTDPLTQYIDDTGALARIPAQPSRLHAWNWHSKVWEPTLTYDLEQIRVIRNAKLRSSDWVDMPAAQTRFTDAEKAEWATYRQALRDITTIDMTAFAWPVQPGTTQPDQFGQIQLAVIPVTVL